MHFGISYKDGELATVEVKLTFQYQIKAQQFKDKKLNTLKNKLVYKKVEDSTLNVSGVLWFKGRIYVS